MAVQAPAHHLKNDNRRQPEEARKLAEQTKRTQKNAYHSFSMNYSAKQLKPVLLFFLSLCWQTSLWGQASKAHPYLFYTPQRTERLKERMKTDTLLAGHWEAIRQRCNNWLAEPKGGNMEQLAFAYTMTDDKRYADRAGLLLKALVERGAWDGMDDRSPRWNAGLGTSHTNWTASVTYDAIYKALTKDERKAIAARIVTLGIEPSVSDWLSKDKRIQSLNNMGHNWWAAIVFEAGVASLAVMNEVPEARKWAADIMQDSRQWFAFAGSVLENKPSNFDPAGGFYESVSYANYGVSEYLLFRLAYTNAVGKVDMPYDKLLQKTVDWFINASYPRADSKSLMSLNFGDSNDFANGDRPAKLLIELGLGKDDYYWYLKHTARNAFREDLGISTPMGLLYDPEHKPAPATPSLPTSALYESMGWGMLRDSWKPDATLLGVKCGFTWNHAHADAGSFVLYHKGENLLIDGGDVGYGNPEYSSYFVTSRAHNVLMFNGAAQDTRDQYSAVKNPGQLYNLIDGGTLKYILADATGPTARNFLRNYRNFLWIGNVILIIDDVKTYEIGSFDYLLHYADKAVKRGPDFEITKDSAAILFRPLYPEMLPLGYPHDLPEKMKFRTEYGLKDRTTNVQIPYYVLSPPEKTDRTKFVNAIVLLDETNQRVQTATGSSGASGAVGRSNLPVIETFEGTNYIGVRITQNGQVTEVFMNLLADGRLMHRNANAVINGWETDAYIAAVSFPVGADRQDLTKLSSVFIGNGSYLRRNGKPLVSSLSKVFLYAAKTSDPRTGNQLDVQLQGQPLIEASLGFGKVNKLIVNHKTVFPRYDSDQLLQVEVNETK
ncbi:heparinase II/III family protein [Spirosoma sp.]|uniref:heparinase II/III domain-containing protein n=1 Tax=Spirosoma sp. TaxID=1899569 RepID=UPI002619CD94|nr:heparinase II/III family protein [Spirosoma sp.]MCX6215786.1 heparinase II/III family protein [Spirosoma sp.]